MKKELLIFFLIIITLQSKASERSKEPLDLYEMSFEELSKLHYTASITGTSRAAIPASVTLITHEMISQSGARSLDELFEIFVPNFMVLNHFSTGPKLGLRGIISDRDSKTLIIVNGRVMNHKSFFGAVTERRISMLGDINYINVIRGSGSAIYGPGAINGVIDIHTHDSNSFEGASVNVRQGFLEGFSSFELKLSQVFDSNSGMFLYYGVDDYSGASPGYAPSFRSIDVPQAAAGHEIDSIKSNNHSSYAGKARHKLHLSFNRGGFDVWARYTRGSNSHYYRNQLLKRGMTYQQFTFEMNYFYEFSSKYSMSLSHGFDTSHSGKTNSDTDQYQIYASEEEFKTRAFLYMNPFEDHKLTLGFEHSRDYFGQDTFDFSKDYSHAPNQIELKPWKTDTISVLGEYQWQISSKLAVILSGRVDSHKFTNNLFSPKVSFVYIPNNNHSFKLLYNRSLRILEDHNLKVESDLGTLDDYGTESIDNWEFIYSFENDNIKFNSSLFYYEYDVVGFNPNNNNVTGTGAIGFVEVIGVELELQYTADNYMISLSHGFSQLLNSKSTKSDFTTTSELYGFGKNLSSWSPHISKIYYSWDVNEKININSSLQVYWGFPGASDYADYNNSLNASSRPKSDGRTDAFNASVFLNLGASYSLSDEMNFSLKFHNILGWIDPKINKKNFIQNTASYWSEAPSVSLTLTYEF